MGSVRIFILWLQWIFFGRRSVVLIDYDKTARPRLVHGFRNYLWAKRFGFGIHNVSILPNGEIGNGSYVIAWEPLFPMNFEVRTAINPSEQPAESV